MKYSSLHGKIPFVLSKNNNSKMYASKDSYRLMRRIEIIATGENCMVFPSIGSWICNFSLKERIILHFSLSMPLFFFQVKKYYIYYVRGVRHLFKQVIRKVTLNTSPFSNKIFLVFTTSNSSQPHCTKCHPYQV